MGEDAVSRHAREGLGHGRQHGFQSEYGLLRFLNLMFVLGEEFDSCPEHAWAGPILASRRESPTTPMDWLIEETYSHLYPRREDRGAVPAGPGLKAGGEFDSIVRKDDSDPNYVPVSIVPEIVPYERGPNRGSVAAPSADSPKGEGESCRPDGDRPVKIPAPYHDPSLAAGERGM